MPRLTADQAARVEEITPRVDRLAIVVQRSWPTLSIDELRSAGYEGLVQAALRYDPSCGVTFGTFAHPRIKGAMLDHGRRQHPGSRRLTRAQRALAAHAELYPDPSESQIGKQSTLLERLHVAQAQVEQAATATLLTHSLEDHVTARDRDPESHVIDDELKSRVRHQIALLAPDERALIEAIYLHGEAMTEYADRVGVNRSTITRRHQRILERLGKRLRPRPPLRFR